MNIRDLLDDLKIPYAEGGAHHHVSYGWVGIDCPSCSPGEGKFKLGISLAGTYSSCWSCGFLPLARTLAELSGVHEAKIRQLLGPLEKEWESRLEVRGRLEMPKGIGPLLPIHKTYLRSRNFDPAVLEKLWGLQGIGLATKLAWRLFIPVTYNGKTVSWTTRSLCDVGRRYVSAEKHQEALPIKSVLYGGDYVRHAAVVCEGPADVWRIGPGAVATLGVGYSRRQVLLLSRIPLRAVAFDNEPDAQRRAKELCKLLEPFPGKTYRVELAAKDAGSATEREINQLRKRFLE